MEKLFMPTAPAIIRLPEKEKKKTVKEKIKAIKGAKISDYQVLGLENCDVFSIGVEDEKAWLSKKECSKLSDIFGELVYNRFESEPGSPRFNKLDKEMKEAAYEYVRENLSFADKIFVISDKIKEKIIGFVSESFWENKQEEKVAFINLVMVDEQYEGKNYAKELLKMVFEQEDIQAVIGASLAPQAVKNRLTVGEEMGYSGFFCGEKVYGGAASPEEKEKAKELNQLIIDSYKEWEYFDNERQEEGFVVITPENAMYPCREDQLHFSPEDPLGNIFKNKLLAKQAEADGTVYGALISLKRPKTEVK
jgi:hypothetical protein